jgi:lysophospholipase L1-like esterase
VRKLPFECIVVFSILSGGCSANGDPAVQGGGGGADVGPGGAAGVGVGSGGTGGDAITSGPSFEGGTPSMGGGAGGGARDSGGNAGAGGSAGKGGAGGSGGSIGRDAGPSVDGGSGGAMSDYNPCPAKGAPCTIMPFGDSLTQGDHGDNTADGGYRPPLFHLALAHGQSITFVGQGSNGPDMVDGTAFPKHHDGFPGFSIDGGGPFPGITSFAADHIKMYKPQIVTLMIGTNDVASQIDLANAPTRLGHLMDVILEADPNLLLVVAQVSPSKDDMFNTRAATYNAAIPGLVKTRADAGKHIVTVDMWSAFMQNANYRTEYLNDIVHCKNAGYSKMADVWYAGIGSLFR